jgi:hypothetical protein
MPYAAFDGMRAKAHRKFAELFATQPVRAAIADIAGELPPAGMPA